MGTRRGSTFDPGAAGITIRSSGRPTARFERIAASNERKPIFIASPSGVPGRMLRSSIGLPYLVSPIWKNGLSGLHSMKFPAE